MRSAMVGAGGGVRDVVIAGEYREAAPARRSG